MKFYLTGQKLERVDELETIANNSIDYTEAEFVIDNPRFKEKEINAINAIFQNEETEVSYTVKLDDTYKVDVPYEAIKDTEQVNISLVALSDNRVYTTSQVKVKLKNSGYNDAETPGEPTPTVYQQLLTEMNGKQNKLTAGDNITISEDNVISATGGSEAPTYTAGDNIQISPENVISATNNKYSIIKDEVPETPNSIAEYHLVDITSGQPVEVGESIPIPDQSLTAGENVTINNGVISADVSMQDITELNGKIANLNTNKQGKLTAGDNITISEDNVISATGGESTTYTAGDYINIENNKISAKVQKSTEDAGDNLATIQNLYDLESASEGINLMPGIFGSTHYISYHKGLINFNYDGTINANTYISGNENEYAKTYLNSSQYTISKSLIFNSGDYNIDLIFNNNGVETTYNKKAIIDINEGQDIEFKLKVNTDINVTIRDVFRLAIVPNALSPSVINTNVELNEFHSAIEALNTANSAADEAFNGVYNTTSIGATSLSDIGRVPKFMANIDNGNPKMVEDAPDEMKQISQENLFGVFISKDEVISGYGGIYSNYYVNVYRLQVHYLDNGTYKIANYIKYIYTKGESTYQTEWTKEDASSSATYTAGTGINISNNIVSLDINTSTEEITSGSQGSYTDIKKYQQSNITIPDGYKVISIRIVNQSQIAVPIFPCWNQIGNTLTINWIVFSSSFTGPISAEIVMLKY